MVFYLLDEDYDIWKTFNFNNFWRNEILSLKFYIKTKKTGTTIIGMLFSNGIVLAADTRATNSKISCDNCCNKIHFISKNISCCGAGTSADIENITKITTEQLELQEIFIQKIAQIQWVVFFLKDILYQFQGFISASLIVGGFDSLGGQLYGIYPHGSIEKLPFISMGSGSIAATSILEKFYSSYMNLPFVLSLAKEAILAGIYNDLGSGGSVDVCIITKQSTKLFRNYFSKFSLNVYSECVYSKSFSKIF